MAVEGSTTKAVFESYVERFLAPSLCEGQVVIVDNLGAHKGERVRELIEARRAILLFLPAYSPDFSPIEEAFSKVKALLKKAAAHTREALVEAIAMALESVTHSAPDRTSQSNTLEEIDACTEWQMERLSQPVGSLH